MADFGIDVKIAPAASNATETRKVEQQLGAIEKKAEQTGQAIATAIQDGFRLAEEDLELRGGGELLGTRQSGDTPFRIASLEQIQKLLPLAHDDARLLIERDGGLTGSRGEAARLLLYLFERDWGVQLLRGG